MTDADPPRAPALERVGGSGDPGWSRQESFVLRITLAGAGQPVRSTVRHVRSQAELPIVGWDPAAVVRFVEDQAGVPRPADRAEPVAVTVALANSGYPTVTVTPRRELETGHPLVEPTARAKPGPGNGALPDSVALIEIGVAFGGAGRAVDLAVPVEASGPFGYDAELLARGYGRPAAFEPVAMSTGRGEPPRLQLRFRPVDLPDALVRLRVRLAIRPVSGVR